MKTMSSTKEKDFEKKLKAFHRRSPRHVLVLETTMSYKDKCNVFHYADLIRMVCDDRGWSSALLK